MKSLYLLLLVFPIKLFGQILNFSSAKILQGEPIIIEVRFETNFIYIENELVPVSKIDSINYVFWTPDLDARVGTYDICDESNGEIGQFFVKDRPGETREDTIETEFEIKSEIVNRHFDSLVLICNSHPLLIDELSFPLKNMKVYSGYAKLRSGGGEIWWHKAIDLSAPVGTPIYSVGDGIVVEVGEFFRWGKVIMINHGGGIISFYLHLSGFDVEVGDSVEIGEIIGKTGATGNVTGPHLHFAIRTNGKSTDPLLFIERFNKIID